MKSLSSSYAFFILLLSVSSKLDSFITKPSPCLVNKFLSNHIEMSKRIHDGIFLLL